MRIIAIDSSNGVSLTPTLERTPEVYIVSSFGACPQCSTRMVISHMSCWSCGTEVRGRLGVPILARLPGELSGFLLTFLQANGSLSKVQTELGCSYPKVRRLLNEVMAFLREEVEADRKQKDDILVALEQERITGNEALKLIRALSGLSLQETAVAEEDGHSEEEKA